MVTDAVTERPKAETAFPYGARLLVTLLGLALYGFGHRVPLPFVSLEIYEISPKLASHISLLALGITPLLISFFLVELFAVATSAGRRLRQSGAGRARLNRTALVVGLALAALQAASIAHYLEVMMSGPSGDPIVATPGFGFSLFTILTLTAATAASFAGGQLLSVYGIGNGFALLTLTDVAENTLNELSESRTGIGQSPLDLTLAAILVVLGVLVFRFVRKSEALWMPAFPQSLLPALAVPWLWRLLLLSTAPTAVELALALALILLLSWLGFHLFSSRARLAASLSEPDEILDGFAGALRRQTLIATALLAAGTVALLAWRDYRPSPTSFAVDFPHLVLVLVIGLDLWDQYRFQRRHGRTARLAQLDNVHFSYRLEERLQEEEIPALARGHQLRSLFFFFGALYKIDVFVPKEQLDRARGVLAELEMAREIRVF